MRCYFLIKIEKKKTKLLAGSFTQQRGEKEEEEEGETENPINQMGGFNQNF